MVLGGFALILLLAFFIGFAKGFKRIGWDWFACLVSVAGYVLLDGFFKKKNLMLNVPTVKGVSGQVLTTFIIAFGCLAIVLVIYGLCSALLRPREAWVKKDKFLFRRDQKAGRGDGNPKRLVYKNYAPPKLFGRLFGGVICMTNAGVVLALMASLGLLAISGTSIGSQKFASILQSDLGKDAMKYATRYALDFISLCIPFFLACYGFKRGFVKSLRAIIANAGSILAVGVAIWLPFSPLVGKGKADIVGQIISRCNSILGSGIPEKVKPIVAKLIAAMFLVFFFFFIVLCIVYILKKYEAIIEKARNIRNIDGVVSCILYFIIGIGVCGMFWCGLYAVDLLKIFDVRAMISEDASLANELFAIAERFMQSVVKPLVTG